MKINTKPLLNPSREIKDKSRKNLHIEQAKTERKSKNKTSIGVNDNSLWYKTSKH